MTLKWPSNDIDTWIQEPLEEIHLAGIRSNKIREFFKQSRLQHWTSLAMFKEL